MSLREMTDDVAELVTEARKLADEMRASIALHGEIVFPAILGATLRQIAEEYSDPHLRASFALLLELTGRDLQGKPNPGPDMV